MSDDLIEMLRREPRIEPFSNQGEPDYRPSIEHRAADEIERLRAENARLREALEKIAGQGASYLNDAGNFHRCQDEARAALQNEGDD